MNTHVGSEGAAGAGTGESPATGTPRRPRLAVTLGDPRGIGPEIVAAVLAREEIRAAADFVVIGPEGTAAVVTEPVGRWDASRDERHAGRLAGLAIERAASLALDGAVHGIVTAPISKPALHAAGYDHPGHTEMLASLAGRETAMMLADSAGTGHVLRVVLATTHIALRDVPRALTRERIGLAARLTRTALREWFDVAAPRIALCALNPHAGDGGRFGTEDDALLAPAAAELELSGPLSADTVFVRALRGEFDAVIAPYHDVGMTAIKVAAFGRAVNVTLGLPFPRTSPDHGTAFDIAGRGAADPASFAAAVHLCTRLARRIATPSPARQGAS